jgi:hypothetical protein
MGVPASDDFFTDTVLNDTINLALEQVDAEQRWPWDEVVDQFPLAVGADTIVLPDRRATRSVLYKDTELGMVAPGDLYRVPTTTAGTPEIFAEVEGAITVRPVPTVAVTLTHVGYYQAIALVVDADTSPLPQPYRGAVVSAAAAMLSAREDDQTARAAHLADYQGWIQRMRREVRGTVKPTTPRIRPGSWV